ncbi:hypothetical protein TRFO_08034 [Tritrichomonas foetus]|uniref:Uncharacterized protein n=1 Tax=Tritrichomonas foetus TaxID=1144522 RepID=A0A1J4JRE4_9EUKA|nr:hypothetical protein TRFO_08034 [Tritrichomonas foetus]|eukprot:OHT00084.1 hypothetical protein TRFO_08034 [Tritrichomonas foetus]
MDANAPVLNEQEHPIVAIKRIGKRRKLTAQTIRDNEKLNNRILKNQSRIKVIDKQFVNSDGRKMKMADLLKIAVVISRYSHKKIDRIAKRNRMGLLCWISENFESLSKRGGSIPSQLSEANLNNIGQMKNLGILETDTDEAKMDTDMNLNIINDISNENNSDDDLNEIIHNSDHFHEHPEINQANIQVNLSNNTQTSQQTCFSNFQKLYSNMPQIQNDDHLSFLNFQQIQKNQLIDPNMASSINSTYHSSMNNSFSEMYIHANFNPLQNNPPNSMQGFPYVSNAIQKFHQNDQNTQLNRIISTASFYNQNNCNFYDNSVNNNNNNNSNNQNSNFSIHNISANTTTNNNSNNLSSMTINQCAGFHSNAGNPISEPLNNTSSGICLPPLIQKPNQIENNSEGIFSIDYLLNHPITCNA